MVVIQIMLDHSWGKEKGGDIIETYKLLTRKEDVNLDIFFQVVPDRGDQELAHGIKIYKCDGGLTEEDIASPLG